MASHSSPQWRKFQIVQPKAQDTLLEEKENAFSLRTDRSGWVEVGTLRSYLNDTKSEEAVFIVVTVIVEVSLLGFSDHTQKTQGL